MRANVRFAVALVLCIGFVAAALGGTIWRSQNNDALVVGELLRIEPEPESASIAGSHFQYSLEILRGDRPWTEADMEQRFATQFREVFPAEQIQADFSGLLEETGPLSFVRFIDRLPQYDHALIAAQGGRLFELGIAINDDGLIESWSFNDRPASPPLRPWESSLILVGASIMIAGAAFARRHDFQRAAWMLLATSVAASSGILILSRTSGFYSLGRTLPCLVVAFSVALLLGGELTRRRLAGGAAIAATVAGLVAPFTRDATLIGHPTTLGAVTDNEATYRILLTTAAGFTAVAFGAVAYTILRSIKQTDRLLRPSLWGTATVSSFWAIVAAASALDLALGDGLWATGSLRATTLVAVALMPVAVVFHLGARRWARPALAELVIDLESDGVELQPAIARALGDPSLQVLTSPDGQSVMDDAGDVIDPDLLPAGRSLTRIQSGSELVGALVHVTALQRHPDRLQSVAAAAGMAMQVSRLNEKVLAQLVEVDASRTRILEASDNARRRVERDLHDGAQQRLVALGMRLQKARRTATNESADELAGQLDEATGEVRDILQEIRDVSRGAQPALLAERGLVPAVDALTERAPVPVTLNIADIQLSSDMERVAYFVIAEGLTNMAKHADASKAEVSMSHTNGVAQIRIADDGTGGATMTAGSGLEGLQDRVAAAGGEFIISSGPTGTTLEAVIPCE